MSREVSVNLVDDLSGGPADETVEYSINGTKYEIDLNASNIKKFNNALSRYVTASRKVSGGKPRKTAPKARRSARRVASDPSMVRAWAAAEGYEVAARGKISQAVMEAYEAAKV